MTQSRIFLGLFVIILTVLLYLLPRYVVNNAEKDVVPAGAEATTKSSIPTEDHNHAFHMPDSMIAKVAGFYDSYKNAENQEKRFIFADSLAKAYKTVGKLDSLAKYLEVRALEVPSQENFIIAGDGYYEAFNFAVDQAKRKYIADKVQQYYKSVLEEDASLLDIQSKLAMTYVAGSNPMQGIMMLREVLEKDPENTLAIYNLGVLAITSGQIDKALERFEHLKQLEPEKPEAHFYIGYCLYELGKKAEAKPYFEKVLELGISGDLVEASKEYLKKI